MIKNILFGKIILRDDSVFIIQVDFLKLKMINFQHVYLQPKRYFLLLVICSIQPIRLNRALDKKMDCKNKSSPNYFELFHPHPIQ